jgi:pSer/pThr/pTyr-binding forkhead associated (FHA) protein
MPYDGSNPRFKLVLTTNDGPRQEFVLNCATANLGRDVANDIVLHDAKVSSSHARIACSAVGCTIQDLGSANGTRVNGKVVQKSELRLGDTICLGNNILILEAITDERDENERTLVDPLTQTKLADNSISVQIQNNVLPRLLTRIGETTTETEMAGDILCIGRASDNDIVISMSSVSRHHARLERKRNGFFLRDLNSDNGIWVGRARVSEATLHHGDSFRIGGAQLIFKHSFAPQDLTREGKSGAHVHYPVVFVPGFAGSKLWLGDEQIWPRLGPVRSGGDLLKFRENNAIRARGLVDQVVIVPNLIKLEQYSRLSEYLEEGLGYQRGQNLLEFAYDFRQDIRLSASGLAAAIAEWKVPRPITIIAHSMGCLVSRYYVDQLGGHKHVGRLILMGGPHAGVPKAFTTLFLGPQLLPFGWLDEQLREVIATFPSAYQILPCYTCIADQHGKKLDIFADDSWLPQGLRHMLAYGKEFRAALSSSPRVPSVCIFGYGLKTITSVTLRREKDEFYDLQPAIEPKGDSTVPERSAMLGGCEIHPVRQYHGALFVDNDVKMRLKIELTRNPARDGLPMADRR